MSDAVTNVEIEDVLSSIRRLVSEESRAEPPRQADPEPEPEPRAADKLVLTPALRVAEPPDEDHDDPAAEAAESENTAEARHEEPEPWKDPAATLYAAAEAAGEHPDEALDSGDQDATEPDIIEMTAAELWQAEETGAQETDDPEDNSLEPGAEAEDLATALDHDGDGDSEEEAGTLADVTPTEDAAQDVAPDAAAWAEEPAEDAPDPATSEDDRPFSERIAELEAKIGETQDEWEPDGTGTDPYAGTEVETLEWQDHVAEEDERPEPLDPSRYMDDEEIDEDLAEDREALTGDDSFLDEESLRELVADIVREELQGALGERITRNVRKLVRREIHRALTAQELE